MLRLSDFPVNADLLRAMKHRYNSLILDLPTPKDDEAATLTVPKTIVYALVETYEKRGIRLKFYEKVDHRWGGQYTDLHIELPSWLILQHTDPGGFIGDYLGRLSTDRD